MAEESLAVKYIEYMDLLEEVVGLGNTYDDFFDWAGVPMKHRTDFAISAILKQVMEIIDSEDKE